MRVPTTGRTEHRWKNNSKHNSTKEAEQWIYLYHKPRTKIDQIQIREEPINPS